MRRPETKDHPWSSRQWLRWYIWGCIVLGATMVLTVALWVFVIDGEWWAAIPGVFLLHQLAQVWKGMRISYGIWREVE